MLTILAWTAGIYVVVLALLFVAQRNLLFLPNPIVADPGDYALDARAIRIPTEDGYKLLAWWAPPSDARKPVVVYFHGNAGHLGYRAEKVRPILAAGYGLLLVSYRYNAGAGGGPSERGLYRDGHAAFDFLAQQGIADPRVVLYGESLGSAVAVENARGRDLAAVILEAPFSSIAAVAQYHYWYVPARWLVRDRFDARSRIGEVHAPLLVVHGERDRVVPLRFGRALFEAANEPKQLVVLEAAGHNDLFDRGAIDVVMRFLAERFP